MTASDEAAAPEQPTTSVKSHTPADLRVERGTCYALFAYDVGLAVDLDEAQRRITADKQRSPLRHKRRAPYYFEYQPAPLRVGLTVEAVCLGDHLAERAVDALIYDFGAVSVQFSIHLRGPLPNLLTLSDELYDNERLLAESHRLVEGLLRSISPAVTKPRIPDLVEDYAIYQIDELAAGQSLGAAAEDNGLLLAQILRAERTPLSQQETQDALACQLSFSQDDRALIDWNAALLFGRDLDDVRAVLEFANVELLEMRYLDDRLDDALDQAYETFSKRTARLAPFLGSKAADLTRVAELQMDSALLYEGVNNALKLLGDQYLARVHRLVSQRFHLADWDRSILRKLQTIESIYEKISDHNANRRMEVLEWIIIILIAISIAMPLVPGFPA